MKKLALGFGIALALSGCGGGGGSDSSDRAGTSNFNVSDINGAWVGTIREEGEVFDITVIANDGRILGVSEQAGVFYSATYVAVEDGYEAAIEGTSLVVNGSNRSDAFFEPFQGGLGGAYATDYGTTGIITLQESSYSKVDAGVLDLLGAWYSEGDVVEVFSDGKFSGTFPSGGPNCTGSGTISDIGAGSVFTVSLKTSSCEATGSFSGLAVLGDGAFLFLAENSNFVLANLFTR